jgi:hypothetical protein
MSGIKNNYLFVLNVHEINKIHRIQLKDEYNYDKIENYNNVGKFKVLATCITTTLDLFILSKDEQAYQVLHIDLDKNHRLERSVKIDHMFNHKIIFEFNEKDVDKLEFKSFHCRGSSKKEKIDTNHKLLMFFHFGEKLYSYVDLKQKDEDKHLEFVSHISSDRLYFINESKFLFMDNH